MLNGNEVHRRPWGFLTAIMLLTSLVAGLANAAWSQAPATEAERSQFGPITPEHTLWRIASEHRPDESVTIQQYMLALVEANPHAFIAGNASLMRSGVMLELPSTEAASAVPAEQARQSLQQQQEWLATLSGEEIREVRLGESAAGTVAVTDSTLTPAPQSETVIDPEAGASTDEGLIDTASLDPLVQDAERIGEAPEDVTEQGIAEPIADPIADPIAESIVEPITEPTAEPPSDATTEPEALSAPLPAAGTDRLQVDRSVTDPRAGLPLSWLLVGLLILAGLAILWMRRRAVANESGTEVSPTAEPEPVDAPAIAPADGEVLATATDEGRDASDWGKPTEDLDERPTSHRSSAGLVEAEETSESAIEETDSASASDGEPAPSAQGNDNPWADLEASVIISPEPPVAPGPESTDQDKASKPRLEDDLEFDFGQVDPAPVDDMVLSSKVEPEPGEAEDPLDLDFNFSSHSEPADPAEPKASGEPDQPDRMSDSEAEVNLDLARALATSSERDYARELLEEVIANGSETMASRAREILDQLG